MEDTAKSAEGLQEKKNQFENLSKEELIIKCKQFLTIAKKAKASKDDAFEEIKSLKAKLLQNEETQTKNEQSIDAMKALVDDFTLKKLADVNEIDILSKRLSENEKKFNEKMTRLQEAEIEVEALKRQLQRSSDDNDSLLQQLQNQEDLAKSDQNDSFKEKVQLLEVELEEKTKENRSLQDIIEKNSQKIKNLIQENSNLKDDAVPLPKDELKIRYDKCIGKLKFYREKIYVISEKLILLKADREMLMKTSKDYSQYVSKWQVDIANAALKMTERMHEYNKELKAKTEENNELKTKIDSMLDSEKIVTDLKLEIENLKETLAKKEKDLNEEKDASKKIKQSNNKKSVLDLEIEAYEKTLDELNKKLEAKKLQEKEFENTIQIQVETIESLKSQIKSLEAHLESEKVHSLETKKHLDNQQNILRKTEHERSELNIQFELLTKNIESLKLENSEIKLQMSNDFGALQKRYQSVEEERDANLRTIAALENEMETVKKLSNSQEREIEDLKSEFASYKIRAQSVLRQSQTKDLSKELELQDEIKTLQKAMESIQDVNTKQSQELQNLKKNYEELSEDKVRLQKRCKELLDSIDEALEESKNRSQVHEDAIKTYQQQIDTINAYYKKKVQENETANNAMISELNEKNLKLEKSLQLMSMQVSNSFEIYHPRNEENKLTALKTEQEELLAQRTEAEGSEDQQSSHSSTFQNRRKLSKNTRELMPLEDLLNSSFENASSEIQEDNFSNYSTSLEIFEQTKSKLAKEENLVTHLKSLLAESEKDLARMEQLNEMLKEEIRRQQRNFDREEHIKNSEYLKNVVIKFVTLSNGDEKQRLIPVLNTILRLNPEENTLLQNACKSGWSGLWTK